MKKFFQKFLCLLVALSIIIIPTTTASALASDTTVGEDLLHIAASGKEFELSIDQIDNTSYSINLMKDGEILSTTNVTYNNDGTTFISDGIHSIHLTRSQVPYSIANSWTKKGTIQYNWVEIQGQTIMPAIDFLYQVDASGQGDINLNESLGKGLDFALALITGVLPIGEISNAVFALLVEWGIFSVSEAGIITALTANCVHCNWIEYTCLSRNNGVNGNYHDGTAFTVIDEDGNEIAERNYTGITPENWTDSIASNTFYFDFYAPATYPGVSYYEWA